MEAGYSSREPVSARLQNTAALHDLRTRLPHLTPPQVEDFVGLFKGHSWLDTVDTPQFRKKDNSPKKEHAYRLSPLKRFLVQQELDYMLEIGVI